jgi:hypothetical protein
MEDPNIQQKIAEINHHSLIPDSETILVNSNDLHDTIKSSSTFTNLFENDAEDLNVNFPISKQFIFHNLEIENYEKFIKIFIDSLNFYQENL